MTVLQKMVGIPGVLVACGGEKSALEFAFANPDAFDKEQWKALFPILVTTMEEANVDEIKVVLSGSSVVFRSVHGVFLGVVVLKGHPVVKSLQRMMRRGFRKMGVPVPSEISHRPAPASSVPSVSAASPVTTNYQHDRIKGW